MKDGLLSNDTLPLGNRQLHSPISSFCSTYTSYPSVSFPNIGKPSKTRYNSTKWKKKVETNGIKKKI